MAHDRLLNTFSRSKYSFPQIAELTEMVLKLLSENDLFVASMVCRLWRFTANKLRASRRYCVTCLVEENEIPDRNPFDLIQQASRFIDELYFEPSAVIVFANFYPMHNFFFPKRYLHEMYKILPKRCVMAGCTGNLIVGSTFKNTSGESLKTYEVERRKCFSMLFVPRAADTSVCCFYIPLKNKYKKIQGVRAFLPNKKDVKLVVVFAHPLSLGKLTHLTVAIRDKYGDRVTIVGGYSDAFLFHYNEVTSNEIVGLVFSGNLQTTSVVIDDSNNTDGVKSNSASQAVKRLQNSGVRKENSFGLMFTCSSREDGRNSSKNHIYEYFCANFPDTPLIGFSGSAAFGCDMETLKLLRRNPGGRDFLQTNSTVICLCSMERC